MRTDFDSDIIRLYMAPEILRYEKYDAKADLWSLGAVLYEMSVGKPPFRAQNHVDLLRKINEGEDQINFRDSRSAVKVAQNLKTLIRGLLKRNPRERMGFEDFFEAAEIVSNLNLSTLPGSGQQGSTGGLRSRVPSTAPRSRSAVPPPLAPRPAGPPLAPTTTTTSVPQQHEDVAAFAVSAGISAYANPIVVPLPISRTTSSTKSPTPTPAPTSNTASTTTTTKLPPTIPSSTSTPSYIDHEPPPFARRPSNATPSGVPVGASGLRRSNSAALRYGQPQSSSSQQESSSKPLAIPGAGRQIGRAHV